MSETHIKEITAQDTYPVRHPVLRKGKPITTCAFQGDTLASTIHLGFFLEEHLVGVATFLDQQHVLFKELNQYQLRGMAILEEHQKKGFGIQLLKAGEALLKIKNTERLWFNARAHATSFYQKLGYVKVGDEFNIPDIGAHYLMTKTL